MSIVSAAVAAIAAAVEEKSHKMGMPTDPVFLAEIARLAIARTQLQFLLRYTVKVLAKFSGREALDATSEDRMPDLRDRIKLLFKDRRPTAREKCQLDALLLRTKRELNKCNQYLHATYSSTTAGQTLMHSETDVWGPPPSIEEIKAVTLNLLTLAEEFNEARLRGFIAEVAKRPVFS